MDEEIAGPVEVDETPVEVAPEPSTPPEPPDVTVAVTVPDPPPLAVPDMSGGGADQTRDMELGAIRATLDAHLQQYGEDDAEWESRVTALELEQEAMTARFSEESQTLRTMIAEAAARPIAEVYLPPEPEPLPDEEAESPEDAPLAARPLDEAAAAVIAPVKNALNLAPQPERKLRRRHRQR
jgi:hypothetical protein